MPVSNQDITVIFERYAVLLELEGANPFRVRAYQNAANTISSLPFNIAEHVTQGRDPRELAGVGKDLAEKIKQIVGTGKLEQLEALEARTPAVLLALLKFQGLGPKRVRLIREKLSPKNLDEVKHAAQTGKIRALSGFGRKTEEQILRGIEHCEENRTRTLWAKAEPIVADLLHYLRACPKVKRAEPAGSFRRRKETIGDLDILAIGTDSDAIMRHFTRYPQTGKIVSRGSTRSTLMLKNGLQVDLRVVPAASYGAALHYFTGSQAHNIAVRKLAQQAKLKINEYGVYRGRQRVAGKTEAELFHRVGLPYIEPELRENAGELEAARDGILPRLITRQDLRGDLHCHTIATDGSLDLPGLARAARALGYAYLAVTDHSQHLTVAHGLNAQRLFRQIKDIDALNAKLNDLVLLKGIEVDILDDGRLDLPDSVLRELDFTIGSVHSGFQLPEAKQTERILRAMDNPYFTILGHPTGRLLESRPGYTVDLERVILGAKARSCFLELNAHPERLDLTDHYCRRAKTEGVLIAISSDAHSEAGLQCLDFGVNQARRGWLEPRDVLNTRPLPKLRKLFRRK